LTACGASPKESKEEAEAKYLEEKTHALQEYNKCIQDAEEDQKKLDACERLKVE